jgi:transcriptional regulator with XRE-family HTH domain
MKVSIASLHVKRLLIYAIKQGFHSSAMSSPVDLRTLPARLRAAREARGLTQADVARVFGIEGRAVSQWERDAQSAALRKPARPDIARLPLLADTLGVTLDWLLRGADAGAAMSGDDPAAYVAKLRAHLDQMRRLAGPGAKLSIADPAARALVDPATGRTLARIVPFVGRVAAGPWLDATPPYPFDATDEDPIVSTVALGAQVFALEMVGDSMAKSYRSGDRIVIDPERAPRPRHDDVVVRLSEVNDPDYQVTLKRLARIETDSRGAPRKLFLEGRPLRGEPDRFEIAGPRARILGTVVEHLPKAA